MIGFVQMQNPLGVWGNPLVPFGMNPHTDGMRPYPFVRWEERQTPEQLRDRLERLDRRIEAFKSRRLTGEHSE